MNREWRRRRSSRGSSQCASWWMVAWKSPRRRRWGVQQVGKRCLAEEGVHVIGDGRPAGVGGTGGVVTTLPATEETPSLPGSFDGAHDVGEREAFRRLAEAKATGG